MMKDKGTFFMNTVNYQPTITQADVDSYHDNGFLILPDALTPDEIEELRTDATKICRGEYGIDIRNYTPPPPNADEADILRRYLCIHFPHKLSDTMNKYLAHPAIVDMLTKIIGADVKCMQSMLFIKSSGKPGQAWHQDEDFIPTRDRTLTGAWIAMDDATIDNGCLWIIPGSHKHGVLWPQQIQDDPRFDCTSESWGFPYKDEDAIPVEVKAGSIVFFNGYTLHRSLPNNTVGSYRRVLVNHYMSAQSLLPWRHPDKSVGMAIADFRDIVMVAGNDPYAYKGTEEISQPSLRPDKDGGCETWTTKPQEDSHE